MGKLVLPNHSRCAAVYTSHRDVSMILLQKTLHNRKFSSAVCYWLFWVRKVLRCTCLALYTSTPWAGAGFPAFLKSGTLGTALNLKISPTSRSNGFHTGSCEDLKHSYLNRNCFHYKIHPLIKCITLKWVLKAPSTIWALTFRVIKSKNRHHYQTHSDSFMTFTGDITAKLDRKNKPLHCREGTGCTVTWNVL